MHPIDPIPDPASTFGDLAWAAGLFEGEGCISVCPDAVQGPRVAVTLTTTDEDVSRRFAEIMGLHSHVRGPYQRKTKTKAGVFHKPYWTIALANVKSLQVVACLYPWFGERRRAKADEAIAEGAKGRPFYRGVKCGFGNCARKADSFGMCGRHYYRIYKCEKRRKRRDAAQADASKAA